MNAAMYIELQYLRMKTRRPPREETIFRLINGL
jgi:hypothetical protein